MPGGVHKHKHTIIAHEGAQTEPYHIAENHAQRVRLRHQALIFEKQPFGADPALNLRDMYPRRLA